MRSAVTKKSAAASAKPRKSAKKTARRKPKRAPADGELKYPVQADPGMSRGLTMMNDAMERASRRFRILFPNKWNEIKMAMTPLDVGLLAMQSELVAGRWLNAHKIAKDLLPYMHPRLSHIHNTGDRSPMDAMTPEQLGWIIAHADRLLSSGTEPGGTEEGQGHGGRTLDVDTAGEVTLLTVSG